MYKNTEGGGFKKTCRLNCDVIISFVQPNANDRKSFVEENLSIIDSKLGLEIFNKITSFEYCAIVINLYKISTARAYTDYVQYIKLDNTEKVRKFTIKPKSVSGMVIKPVKTKLKIPEVVKDDKLEFRNYGRVIKRKSLRIK
jgi:selenophosphate synthase